MSEESKKPERPFEQLARALQESEARKISQCVEEIDRRLLDCHKSLEEYRRLRVNLRLINSRLSRLGADPLTVADEVPTQDLSEILRSRIGYFKSTGKI
jgi:hypothetical protein